MKKISLLTYGCTTLGSHIMFWWYFCQIQLLHIPGLIKAVKRKSRALQCLEHLSKLECCQKDPLYINWKLITTNYNSHCCSERPGICQVQPCWISVPPCGGLSGWLSQRYTNRSSRGASYAIYLGRLYCFLPGYFISLYFMQNLSCRICWLQHRFCYWAAFFWLGSTSQPKPYTIVHRGPGHVVRLYCNCAGESPSCTADQPCSTGLRFYLFVCFFFIIS